MSDHPKITKLSDAKKRLTVQKNGERAGAAANPKKGNHSGYERAMRKQKGMTGAFSSTGPIRWYHYIQFVLFLGLVAWFMKSCSM